MKDRTRWLLGGLALGAGAIGAVNAYWKRKNVLHTHKKPADVWARPGMEVTFRAELMPSRDRNQRTFLVKIRVDVSPNLSVKEQRVQMTYVVAEPCVNCRYTDCALVCPVEAFHLDDDMLVINPETCIDCDACVPECPVEAVFSEANVPAEWTSFTPLNAERALSGLPTITARLDPLCE